MKEITLQTISQQIYLIRGKRVMVDSDLAELYGIKTKVLNQAVQRNLERFPNDFIFELTPIETLHLKSQFVTSKNHGGRRKPVSVFTQEGVAMLSSVLRSPRVVQVNIAIMRAFVRLHETFLTHKELSGRLDEPEKKYDDCFRIVFEAIRNMMQHSEPPQNKIGF